MSTESLTEDTADLLAAIKEVMEWIRNWDPNFSQDEEWPATELRVKAAIAKAEGARKK